MRRNVPHRVVPLPYRERDSHRMWRTCCSVVANAGRAILDGKAGLLFGAGLVLANLTVAGEMRPVVLAYMAVILAFEGIASAAGVLGGVIGLGIFAGPSLMGQALLAAILARASSRRLQVDPGWVFAFCWFGARLGSSFWSGAGFMSTAAESALLALLVPVLIPVQRLFEPGENKVWSRSEVVGVGLFVAALIMSLSFSYGQIRLADILARYLILLVALVGGVSGGAVTGILCGLVGTLAGQMAGPLVAAYVVGGAVAGLLTDYGKPGVIVGFLVGTGALSWQDPVPGFAAEVILTVPAAVLVASSPPALLAWLGRVLPGGAEVYRQTEEQEERLQTVLTARLREFSKVFLKLADSFTVGREQEEPQDNKLEGILDVVCKKCCESCRRFEMCWQERFYETYCDFLDLVSAGQESPDELSELPAGLAKRCFNARHLIEDVKHVLEMYRLEQAWEERLAESKELVSNQLRGVADVMKSLAERVAIDTGYEVDTEVKLRQILRKNRISVKAVTCLDLKYSQEVKITFTRRWKERDVNEVIAPLLSGYFGVNYSVWTAEKDGRKFTFLPERNFTLDIAARKRAKKPGGVSGDNFARVDLPNGKVAIVLSDGMGHGTEAALESSTTLTMLAELLKAGFDRQFAVKTVNSILMLRSPEDTFATVDMAIIDLFTGETEFMKIGSAPSFIKRGRAVETIQSNSLPIGILNYVESDNKWRLLRHGDLLLMVTDGLIDSRKEAVNWVPRVARQIETTDPQEVVDFVMNKACENCSDELVDDVTIIGVRLLARASVETAGDEDGWVPTYAREAVH